MWMLACKDEDLMKRLRMCLGLIVLILAFTAYKMPSTRAQTAEPSMTLDSCNPQKPIWQVVTSRSGRYLAANWKNGIRVWQVESGNPIGTFTENTAPNQYPNRIAISSDDKYVLTGHDNGLASLWELSTGKKLYSFHLDRKIGIVAFLPGDEFILIADIQDSGVWNIKTKERVNTFSSENKTNMHTEISADGRYLASVYTTTQGASQSKTVFTTYLWDINTGKQLHRFDNTGKAFLSPMAKYMLTVGDEGYSMWDVQTGKQRHLIDHLDGRRRFYAFSPDEKYLLGDEIGYHGDSGTDEPEKDDAIVVWNVQTGKPLHRFEVRALPPTAWFVPNSQHLLVGEAFLDPQDPHSGGRYRVYDLDTGKEAHTFSIKNAASSATASLVTPNGKYLLVASATSNNISLRSWDMRTGNLLTQYC
jgi:WD40 repeat protein